MKSHYRPAVTVSYRTSQSIKKQSIECQIVSNNNMRHLTKLNCNNIMCYFPSTQLGMVVTHLELLLELN